MLETSLVVTLVCLKDFYRVNEDVSKGICRVCRSGVRHWGSLTIHDAILHIRLHTGALEAVELADGAEMAVQDRPFDLTNERIGLLPGDGAGGRSHGRHGDVAACVLKAV